jgi:prepilin-type processing-associated H-X9-DG protein
MIRTPRRDLHGFSRVEAIILTMITLLTASMAIPVSSPILQRMEGTRELALLRRLGETTGRYVAATGAYPVDGLHDDLVRWHGTRASLDAVFDPSKNVFARAGLTDVPLGRNDGFDRRFRRHASPLPLGNAGLGYNPLLGGLPTNAVTVPGAVLMFASTALPHDRALLEYPFALPPYAIQADGLPGPPNDATIHFRYLERANVLWADGHASAERPSLIPGRNRFGGDCSKWKVGWLGDTASNGMWNPGNRANVR